MDQLLLWLHRGMIAILLLACTAGLALLIMHRRDPRRIRFTLMNFLEFIGCMLFLQIPISFIIVVTVLLLTGRHGTHHP